MGHVLERVVGQVMGHVMGHVSGHMLGHVPPPKCKTECQPSARATLGESCLENRRSFLTPPPAS